MRSPTNDGRSVPETRGTLPSHDASILMPSLWNVQTSARMPTASLMRDERSSTVAFVNDRTRISSGDALPDCTRCFTSPTTVVVLPVPAPAMTSLVLTSSPIAVSCCPSSRCPSISPTDLLIPGRIERATSRLCEWAAPSRPS